jgi:hypothetical protein
MSDPKPNDKVEEEKVRPKKPPGYRQFEKLLKQVVKSPPMKRPLESDGRHARAKKQHGPQASG